MVYFIQTEILSHSVLDIKNFWYDLAEPDTVVKQVHTKCIIIFSLKACLICNVLKLLVKICVVAIFNANIFVFHILN